MLKTKSKNFTDIVKAFPEFENFAFGTLVRHSSGDQARVIGYSRYAEGIVDLDERIAGTREHNILDLTPIG
ncbi:hypothetical protein [Neptuniibacter sp. QD37_11]|uniref:hypothetical protein n=1 Tax=Neptuniibacter sp. QD37_11 TaxID=3398209 RepID=UPI0039F53B13